MKSSPLLVEYYGRHVRHERGRGVSADIETTWDRWPSYKSRLAQDLFGSLVVIGLCPNVGTPCNLMADQFA